MKKIPWILPLLAALFLVPGSWAASRVVDADGTVYSVTVTASPGGTAPPGATALSYSILRPDGKGENGTIFPTEDSLPDNDPSLVLLPGAAGPFLIWTRGDGFADQIAFSRWEGNGWSQLSYLTSGPRNHGNAQAAVDSHGMATIVWMEQSETGLVAFGILDPAAGTLVSAPRDLQRALTPATAPATPGIRRAPRIIGSGAMDGTIGISPEGGNDTPAIPPCNTNVCKTDASVPIGSVTGSPGCSKAAAAVSRNRALWFGVVEGGVVLNRFQSTIPANAPDGYVSMLLQSLLDEHCRQ
jgi:hypothetical protein